MKICVAQTQPVKGDITSNIEKHKKLIDAAVSSGSGMIIFPELSLTGYEPKLAKVLATDQNDSRLDCFQQISDSDTITIGVGIPTRDGKGINISMILFQPHEQRLVYSKKYIHADEEEFFTAGQNFTLFERSNVNIALAICYELSVLQHAEEAFKSGAGIYIASVAKTADGVDKAIKRLSSVAGDYAMTVLMSNCVGHCDGETCGGKSSIWDSKGLLLAQLNDTGEGILILDTVTKATIEKKI
ncbi:MAG: carbon-nitrogen hydrolase family protein [Ginsengibacter sp.]